MVILTVPVHLFDDELLGPMGPRGRDRVGGQVKTSTGTCTL